MEYSENVLTTEMRLPSETSKKKKKWVTFICISCNTEASKWYEKKTWNCKCVHCSKGGLTTADFISRGKEHFGDLYDYSNTSYTNKRTNLTIICPTHGEFTQRAQEHLDGHGCNACKFDVKRETQLLPKEEWVTRIKKYPLLSFKDESQIHNYHGQVDLTCKIHGDFTTQLGALTNSKHVCKDCAYHSHQIQSIRPELIGKPTVLYYVYLPDIDMYKLGVTTNFENRIKKLGECEVRIAHSMEYVAAIQMEHKIHTKHVDLRYTGRTILVKNGSTELYKTDISKQIYRALQERSCTESKLNGETLNR